MVWGINGSYCMAIWSVYARMFVYMGMHNAINTTFLTRYIRFFFPRCGANKSATSFRTRANIKLHLCLLPALRYPLSHVLCVSSMPHLCQCVMWYVSFGRDLCVAVLWTMRWVCVCARVCDLDNVHIATAFKENRNIVEKVHELIEIKKYTSLWAHAITPLSPNRVDLVVSHANFLHYHPTINALTGSNIYIFIEYTNVYCVCVHRVLCVLLVCPGFSFLPFEENYSSICCEMRYKTTPIYYIIYI